MTAIQALTAEQRQTAADLWDKLGREPMTRPTPEQELAFYRAAPDDIAVHLIRTHQEEHDRSFRCWIGDHDSELEYLRERVTQLVAATEAACLPKAEALARADHGVIV